MEYDDFVKHFETFTICQLPSKFDESAGGYIFPNQKVIGGTYTEEKSSGNNKFDIVVEKSSGTSHVWIQVLAETKSDAEAWDVYHVLTVKNSKNKRVFPALPFNFEGTDGNGSQGVTNGEMFNLKPGSYRLEVQAYFKGLGYKGNPGRQWVVRVVSPHVTKFGKAKLSKSNTNEFYQLFLS